MSVFRFTVVFAFHVCVI